jgi:hypothetical protein
MNLSPHHSKHDDAQTNGDKVEEGEQGLDPRTAYVTFYWGEIVPGTECVGRIYYWYDREGRVPAINDWDFRPQHPEISDREWKRLFYEAFDRGETEFETGMVASGVLAGLSAEARDSALSLGRIFGPRPPASVEDE